MVMTFLNVPRRGAKVVSMASDTECTTDMHSSIAPTNTVTS
jgi:hypothetical protein